MENVMTNQTVINPALQGSVPTEINPDLRGSVATEINNDILQQYNKQNGIESGNNQPVIEGTEICGK